MAFLSLVVASFLLREQVPVLPATPSYEKRGEITLKQVRVSYLKMPAGHNTKPATYNTTFGGDLNSQGRFIGAMPDNARESWDLILVDENGVSRNIPTGISSDDMILEHVLFASQDSALLVGNFYVDRKAAFWKFTFKTGRAERIWADTRRDPVNRVVRLKNGNFLVHSYLGLDVITPEGKAVWTEKLSNESPFKPPYRIAMQIAGVGELEGNRIGIGHVFSHEVTVFDQHGKLLEPIQLEPPPNVAYFLNYDSFVIDTDGSFWSCCENVLYHFDAKGKFLKSGRIRGQDGFLPSINFPGLNKTWMSPDGSGHVWIGDDQGLYLCQDDGLIIDTRGPNSAKPSLDAVRSITFDSDGNLLCIDARSRSIHRFSIAGAYLGLASDALRSEDGVGSVVQIDGVPRGNIFVRSAENERSLLVLNKHGVIANRVELTATRERRMGDVFFEKTKFVPVPESWRDADGNAVRPLTDASDKPVYLFTDTAQDFRGWFVGFSPFGLLLYDPNGKCVGNVSAPMMMLSNLAYNGKIVIGLSFDTGLCAFSPKGELLWTVTNNLLDGGEVWYDVAISPDGKEIAVLGQDNLVTMYAIP